MDPNKDIRKCIYQQMNNIFIDWDIISFLKINDILYSTNNNGIFININTTHLFELNSTML